MSEATVTLRPELREALADLNMEMAALRAAVESAFAKANKQEV